jgi:hypothetical protein
MKRISTLTLFTLLLASNANCFPWKKIGKIALFYGAPAASSLLATKGGHDCRRAFGPELCTEKYGSFSAEEGFRFGLSFGVGAAGAKCIKDTNWKGCFAFPVVTSAANLWEFHHEENITPPRGFHRENISRRH